MFFFLGIFEVLDLSSIEEPLPLPVSRINAQNTDVTDLTDVMAQLRPHVNILDYPQAKSALLHLLTQHRQAISLPGEPLGVTNKITHHIAFQCGAQPSYVPSYRLQYSQKRGSAEGRRTLTRRSYSRVPFSFELAALFGSEKGWFLPPCH